MSALIRLTLSSSSAHLRPGERTEVTLAVQNLSEIVDRYSIVVLGVPAEWVTLSRPELALFPKDEDHVRVTIQPPAVAGTRGGHYDVRIQAISRETRGEQSSAEFALDVAVVSQLEAALRPQRGSGVGDAVFRLQLSNGGNADLTVQLTATDAEEGLLFSFEPQRLVVPAGQERAVVLRAHPKRPLPGSEPHAYPFTVNVQSTDAPESARSVPGEWVQVAPAYEIVLRPSYASGPADGAFTVVATNQGADDLTLSFEAADSAQACTYLFTPPQAVVPAGQERTLALRVHPRAPLPGSAPQVHHFAVTARPAEVAQSARQAQGEWEQTPLAFDIALRPLQAAGTGEGLFHLQITNPGPVDLTVQLEAADPARACSYTWNPPLVVVPAGQERLVQLRVRANGRLRGGAPLVHTFAVTARPAESPGLVRQVQGQWAQTVPPPPAGRFWGPLVLLVLGWGAAYGLAVALRQTLEPLWGPALFDLVARSSGIPELADFLSRFLAPNVLTGLVLGGAGGLLTGLAALWAGPAVRARQVLAVFFGWLVVLTIQRAALGGLYALSQDAFMTPLSQAGFGAAAGLIGGGLTGSALRRAAPRVSPALLALAWGLAWAAGEGGMTWLWFSVPDLYLSLADVLSSLSRGNPDAWRWILASTVVGLVAGLIGGLATLWQLGRSRGNR